MLNTRQEKTRALRSVLSTLRAGNTPYICTAAAAAAHCTLLHAEQRHSRRNIHADPSLSAFALWDYSLQMILLYK